MHIKWRLAAILDFCTTESFQKIGHNKILTPKTYVLTPISTL